MKSKLALTIALVFGAAGAVSGGLASAGTFATGNFMKMDKDKDGYLTMEEMKGDKELMAQMKKMDMNKDGKLGRKEYSSFRSGQSFGTGGKN